MFKFLSNNSKTETKTHKIYRHLVDAKTGYYVSEVILEGTKSEIKAQAREYKTKGFKVTKNADETKWS
jgi:hypothetical protein